MLARLTDLTLPLRELFGFDAFRPGQEEVVRAAVEGRDTLALMPTGSGKSLTYQLAAMLRPEPTLVLSPLIALMKDQVDKLPPAVAPTATFVNSSLPPEETAARLAEVAAGRKRLVYAAPERLRQAGFVKTLRAIGIGLVVVDEVHCVSMWGHDFRPDYLFIRQGLAELGDPTLLGMTATATPETARAISEALGRSPDVVHTSVVRPNLRYDVEEVRNAEDRLTILVDRLSGLGPGSAIVYARSRRSTEE
ncbi:MAG: DEAD/DEAH box helicase, partial [Actinobacteria bacterium]|nr:DEAD/DEAH box helicase [Actinomycetota bacterium]